MTALDVVIVGGGLGGSALAANLAGAGLAVEMLEREEIFVDRVRGEFMAPWGVTECQRLGIYEPLMAAGGHHVTRSLTHDELIDPAAAEEAALPLGGFVPGVPGPLCMQHVVMQDVLLDHARASGAEVLRGVTDVTVSAGASPAVEYTWQGVRQRRACRLVVGAEGRSSVVRRQLGLRLREEPVDHLISGLLVDDADDWPSDTQALGKAGETMLLIFPQGSGRVRLYVDYGLEHRGCYTGPEGARKLLRAFDHPCLPAGAALAAARPIGPCKAFPSQHAAGERVHVEGAVLIGDAAGYTDPIWGQGLSVTLRDARIVRDLLLDAPRWSADTFEPYAAERAERLRRIFYATRFATALFARFDREACATRARALGRLASEPELGAYVLAAMAGPDVPPPEAFTDAYFNRIFDA